jgi:DNA-binding MarR family transcriptional regulator
MPNPADGRSHFVGLTSPGNAFLRRVAPALERVEHEIGHALGRPLESLRPDLEQLRGAEQALLSREEGELEEGPATAVVFR